MPRDWLSARMYRRHPRLSDSSYQLRRRKPLWPGSLHRSTNRASGPVPRLVVPVKSAHARWGTQKGPSEHEIAIGSQMPDMSRTRLQRFVLGVEASARELLAPWQSCQTSTPIRQNLREIADKTHRRFTERFTNYPLRHVCGPFCVLDGNYAAPKEASTALSGAMQRQYKYEGKVASKHYLL
ncbi:hypothetical protein BDW22DRAFT_1349611 [Trametopsis cervina]|nr:hypothetical protein BDW22DRAFT_1349611 [Trametopsis cervina]